MGLGLGRQEDSLDLVGKGMWIKGSGWAWNDRDYKVQLGSFREVDLAAMHKRKWIIEGGGGFEV